MIDFPQRKVTREDILKDKSISWTIKYDLINYPNVIEYNLGENDFDYKTPLIREIRKFNRINGFDRRYVFVLPTQKIYFCTI